MSSLLHTAPRRWAAYVVALVAGGVLAYSRSLPSHFIGDDAEEILRAADPGRYPHQLAHARGNLRPLAAWSFRVNEHLFGLRPWTYHLVSVGLHVGNALLVAVLGAALVRRLGGRRAEGTGMLAGALFLVMANHTEAVSWIAARADLLATAFCLLAALGWIRSRMVDGPRSRWAWTAASALAFAAALGCKESAVGLPLALAALEVGCIATTEPESQSEADGGQGGSWLRRAAIAAASVWPLLLVLGGYLIWRRSRLGVVVGSYDTGGEYDWSPIRASARLVELVARSALPAGVPGLVGLVVAFAAAVWATVALMRRTSSPDPSGRRVAVAVVAGGAAVAFLALPGAGLGVSLTSTEGERLVYLPSTLVAVLLAAALLALPLPRRAGAAAVAVVVALSTLILVSADARWARAGDLGEQLLERSPAWSVEKPVWVLNPPDTLRGGAYVTRNALAASPILLHGWRGSTPVRDITAVRFASPRDRVRLVQLGPKRWRLDLLAKGARFERVSGGTDQIYAYDGMESEVRGRSLFVDLRGADPRDVWYVDDGRLVPLVR